MSVELVIGNDLSNVTENVISKIEISNSLELENFVIVPDRFSLLAEKQIFNILGISSTFNIKVLGISKLQNYFAPKQETLSAEQSRLLIYSILKNNVFEFFKPKMEVATEIFNIISQLKASKISFEEFKEKAKTKKLLEIAQIFEIYQQTKQQPDQGDVLTNIFENLNTEKVSACSFYLCGFDSLTAQGFSVLEKIMLNAKKVVVGATAPSNQKNSSVYDADILKKINRFSKQNKIKIKKTYLTKKEENLSTALKENLFSFAPKTFETEKVHLLEFETPEQEIVEIAKTILFYVKEKNYKFSDFNILSGNLEAFSNQFVEIFETYKIPVFVDCLEKVENLPIFSFFKNLFSYFLTESETSFFSLLSSPYVNAPKEEISLLKNSVLKEGNLEPETLQQFLQVFEFSKKLINYKEKALKINTFSSFSLFINEIIEQFNLKEKNEEIVLALKDNLKIQKVYSQIFKKLECVLENFNLNEETKLEDCFSLFLLLFGEKEISSAALSVDCVFVGGEKSFFENKKVMFVSNAIYGTLPKVVKDLGIFSDDDISLVNLGVEPTVRMINKRNKQKLLFDLSPLEELFVSFSGSETGEKVEKSVLFLELQKVFTLNQKPIQILNSFYSSIVSSEKHAYFNIQSHQDFKREIINLKNKNLISQTEATNLIGEGFKQEEKISNAKDLFVKFSPTEIEKFFECPFKHFFTYGLKIKENETNKPDGRDFGNYFHMLAKNFAERNKKRLGGLSDAEIKQELFSIDKIVKETPRFKLLSKNINNQHIFNVLKREGEMLLKSINHEQHFSNFVASFFEQYFELLTGKNKLVGIVDRIDISGNLFRVVDYKSGETKKSLRAVYEGLELQLFIYLLAIYEKFGYKPGGAFYLPVGGDYSKENSQKFKLDGFVLNNQTVLNDLDRRLASQKTSDVVNLKLTASSTIENLVLSTKKNVLSEEGFKSVLSYVNLLIKNAEKEILSGEICAKPLGEYACKNCPLFKICSFKENEQEQAKEIEAELTEKDFIRIVENEKN